MPSSLSSSRNVLVERFLSRTSVSLCWTSGCLTTLTPSMSISCWKRNLSEHAAVTDDTNRRAGVRAQRLGKLAARRPGAALKNLCEWKGFSAHSELPPDFFRKHIEQGDRQSAPFNDEGR